MRRFYQKRRSQKQYDHNANVRYLDAVTQKILTGRMDIDAYRQAKELDTLPFRAKEILLKSLRDYCHEQSPADSNLFFVSLGEIMARNNGGKIFGNEIFVDHLHFNQAGQRLVSQILTEQIADVFSLNRSEKARIDAFYQDAAGIEEAIYYLPACRLEVYRTMRSLFDSPPYNKMLVPYQREDVDGLTEDQVDPRLTKLFEKAQSQNLHMPVVMAVFYLRQGKIGMAKRYLDLYLRTYPGSYRSYLVQARFARKFTQDMDKIFENYKTAYLLSGKMKRIYDEIQAFFAEKNREDLFAEIEKYGQPVK